MAGSLRVLCCACFLVIACGVEDTISLLQAERRAQPAATGVDEAEPIASLQTLLAQSDVQRAAATYNAANIPIQDGVARLARLVEDGSLGAALAGAVHSATHQNREEFQTLPELALVKDDMRAALHDLAPSSSHAAVVLQQLGARIGNLSLPAEAEERMREELASAGDVWRQNTEAHDEILGYLPQLYGLVSNHGLFEPLQNASESLQGRYENTVNVLADQFTQLVGAGAKAFGYLGMSYDQKADPYESPPKPWTPTPGVTEPYVRFATHHGIRLRPKSKQGPMFDLTVGYKNHFYWSQLQREGARSFEWGKIVARVGCAYKTPSGHGFAAQFQLDFESPRLSKSVINPFKQAALTLRYFKGKSYTKTTDTGYAASYFTTSQLGPGVQRNLDSTSQFASTWVDALTTFDYESNVPNGAAVGLMPRLGVDPKRDIANKVFVFSKWNFAPKGLPDLRVRVFGRCNQPKDGNTAWCQR